MRVDQFDRFVSVLVFVPRDRYDSVVREKIGAYLKTVFDGRLSAYYPAFPEGGLARVHFIIGRSGGKTPKVEQAAIEAAIRDIVRTWEDALREAAAEAGADAALAGIASRFPESYRDSFTPAEALVDARRIARLDAGNPIAIDYYRHADQKPRSGGAEDLSSSAARWRCRGACRCWKTSASASSASAPSRSATMLPACVFVHDMELENGFGKPIDLGDGGALFEEVFLSVWRGDADNDGYNALAQTAGLRSARSASCAPMAATCSRPASRRARISSPPR